MSDLVLTKVDEQHFHIEAKPSILKAINQHFAIKTPGYQYSPQSKKRRDLQRRGLYQMADAVWDGKRRFYNAKFSRLSLGLYDRLKALAKERGWIIDTDRLGLDSEPLDMDEVRQFLKQLDLPFEPRDYQLKLFIKGIRHRRAVFIAATNAGKSLSLYLIAQWMHHKYGIRTLIIVPTVGLVSQMMSDFKEYGADDHLVSGVLAKHPLSKATGRIVIGTWQSLHKLPAEDFDGFGCLIGDEAHHWQSTRLEALGKKCRHARWRLGCTGTIDARNVYDNLIIESTLGSVVEIVRNAELIERGFSTPPKVYSLILSHTDVDRNAVKYAYDAQQKNRDLPKNHAFQYETDYLLAHGPRNRFIIDLTKKMNGNSLLLFNFIEKHGDILNEMLKAELGSVPLHYVYGETDVKLRETIRKIIDTYDQSVTLANYGVFSTGVSIKRLHNLVFTSPTKSMKRVLQSIGRMLRTADDKSVVHIFDIVDDFRLPGYKNYAWSHYEERKRIYKSEGFEHVERTVLLEGN